AGARTTLTDHALDGVAGDDTTHTYTYTGATGTTGQPNGMQSVTNAGPSGITTDHYTYDADGNTRTRAIGATANQTITYTPQNQPSTTTDSVTGAGSRFTYAADGALLLERDTIAGATTVVLYLGDEQLTLATATGTVSGIRSYSTQGGPIAVRSSSGSL